MNVEKIDMAKMKIEDAKRLYLQWGKVLQPDYDHLIDAHREQKPHKGMPNDNYYHALCLTDRMFRETKHHMRMLSGKDGDGFLTTLRESFEGMLVNITENGGFAHIILVADTVSNFIKEMKEKYSSLQVTLACLKEGRQIAHSIVCDNRMVRDEKTHPPLTEESNANDIKATIYFDDKVVAKVAAENFDSAWELINPPSKE